MPFALRRHLLLEQRAFLARDRHAWREHLLRARAWLGEGLASAPRDRPCVVLGAGWGLEVPWSLAPPTTWGWDADPLSRVGTLLRHRRWAPWMYEDFTGGLRDVAAAAHRCAQDGRQGRRRDPVAGARRLAGILPSFKPAAGPLRTWVETHRPGAILAANVMGQLGPVAQALIRRAFHPVNPFELPHEVSEQLAEALDLWTAAAVRAVLQVMAESGAEVCLLHDRGVAWGGAEPRPLGPWRDPWMAQLPLGHWEVSDALGDVEVGSCFEGTHATQARERWWWPVGPDQLHLVEAWRLIPQADLNPASAPVA
ncbi:MAG TPA: hypothetical protein VJ623_08930 [Holophagaceae bacterium]|nr:hypothetical protein [Holophagaceae bacterium]